MQFVAANRICNEIPGCTSYVPTLTFDGASVTVADTRTRETCLTGYTFLLDSANMYKFGDRMQSLLEVAGAKALSVEDFDSDSQDLGYAEIDRLVLVIPAASADQFLQRRSLSKINEINLISAVISGYLDPSSLISPSVVVSSSCSTDETIVADSDAETETVTSDHPITDNALARRAHDESEKPAFSEHATVTSEATQRTEFMRQNSRTMIREEDKQATEYESKEYKSLNHAASMGNDHTMNFVEPNRAVARKTEDNPELGIVDILYSQNLIARDINPQFATGNATERGVINFKRFRKGFSGTPDT